MLKRSLAATVLLAGSAWTQDRPGTIAPKFEATDVHAAPYRLYPYPNGGVRGNRYIWHQATIVDLIAAAYDVQPDMVQDGPAWLERDRFEVVGLADPKTSKQNLRLMLRSLLAERFALVLREGEKPMPAYVLTLGKEGKPKFEESDGGSEECVDVQHSNEKDPPIDVKCHNDTMADLTDMLHSAVRPYTDHPVVDKTGLKGVYDIELKWHAKRVYDRLGPTEGISIFDAVENQLGLKLALETSPQPVWIIESVNRQPTPNAPDVAKLLPPLPPQVFEIATIKPSAPDTRASWQSNGNEWHVRGWALSWLVSFAWDLNANKDDSIAGAPTWFGDRKFDVMGKLSSDGQANSEGPAYSIDDEEDLRPLVKQLLIERFQLKAHTEVRPASGYTLYAVKPKLKTADATERTRCFEGPGPDGKDTRKTTPILNRLVTCQNTTLADISGELYRIAGGYIYGPVLDKSELKGAYDFTFSFSSRDRTLSQPPPAAGGSDSDAGDPSGALTLYEAFSRQLGLKLVKEKQPMPVLVIDSVLEKPVEP